MTLFAGRGPNAPSMRSATGMRTDGRGAGSIASAPSVRAYAVAGAGAAPG